MNLLSRTLTILLLSTLALSATAGQDRPNILWLTCEDNNITWVGCYGNPEANTPNIDQLAREGFQYMHCFANVPVCAPQRSTWITGVHALSMGTQPMRSRYLIPHDIIKYYPDYLKEAGYYVSNSKKTDYNIGGRDDKSPWDSDEKFAWRNRKPGQPFFCIINETESHESKAHGDVENTIHSPDNVELKAYHPDLPAVRKNYAKYHDAMTRMDTLIGQSIAELKKDGLLEDTIIIHNSDHGGVMARSKRFLFESGIHCPLIVRIPEKYKHLYPAAKPGEKVYDIVSFIDMIPTWLSIAGAEIPDHMQGRIFLGEDKKERKFHFAYRDRMDERTDNQRAVHDGRFLYIKNYMPYVPWGQELEYLYRQELMKAWKAHHLAGKTDEITGRFFRTKPVEELYDTVNDPDCVRNLAMDPEQSGRIKEMRAQLSNWQQEIHDAGMIPETMRYLRAKDNDLTLYEMVRDPKLYDLPAYIEAADVALAADPANAQTLRKLADSSDPGLRYWAAIGLLMLGDKASDVQGPMNRLLKDADGEVRAYAAWVAVQIGQKRKGINALKELIAANDPGMVTILNVVDYIGEDARELAPLIAKVDPKTSHLSNYVERQIEYFGEKF